MSDDLISREKLKKHYAWWRETENGRKMADLFDEIVDAQPPAEVTDRKVGKMSDDLISRQAAIDIAMQYCPDDDGSCSKTDRDIRELLDDLENMSSAQRWIPVAERLPEDFQSFYATCRSNIDNRENWVIEGRYTPWKGFDPPPLIAEGKAEIIAWMPKELPEPWKGEDDE